MVRVYWRIIWRWIYRQLWSQKTTVYDTIYNGEATSLIKGTPVYISGSQGANPKVYRADAANPNKMPVTYIVSEEILSKANFYCFPITILNQHNER
jgi:hypothetical protein